MDRLDRPSAVISTTMSVIGAHVLLYTPEADALRSALSIVFGWDSVDAGEGWLIYALPPAELAVHPAESPSHELTLMCDDIAATVAELEAAGIEFEGEPVDEGWGVAVPMLLPGGLRVLLYEPRHASPLVAG